MRLYQFPSQTQGEPGPITTVGGAPLGVWTGGSVMDGVTHLDAPAGSMVAMWSGGLGETLFDASPQTWMPSGRAAFTAALLAASAWATARGVTIALRPHARHVLSDVPTLLALLGMQKGGAMLGPPPGIGALLDPFSMLTARLLPAIDEHLERVLGVVAGLPGVVGVVACNVARPEVTAAGGAADNAFDDGPPLRRLALHEGEIDPRLIADALKRYVPAGVPIVLEADDVGKQASVLSTATLP